MIDVVNIVGIQGNDDDVLAGIAVLLVIAVFLTGVFLDLLMKYRRKHSENSESVIREQKIELYALVIHRVISVVLLTTALIFMLKAVFYSAL